MSGLETINDALHDPVKRKSWAKRLEMVTIVGMMSGAWIAAGYTWGHKDNTREIEEIRADFAAQREKLRETQGKKLEELRTQCTAKAIK